MAFGDVVDGVKEALQDAVNLYGQVEIIKAQSAMTQARNSAAAAGDPSAYQNPQAKNAQAVAIPGVGTLSGVGLLLGFGLFGLAVYMAVRAGK